VDLEVDGEVATVVIQTREGDDSVPLDAPETMARRRRRGFPGTEVRREWRLMAVGVALGTDKSGAGRGFWDAMILPGSIGHQGDHDGEV
jgi:hypothetical protein